MSAPNLGLINVKMATDIAIPPLLNNGKTEVKAGEEAIIYIEDYLQMCAWPENQRPEKIAYIDTSAPAAPAANPGDQIRAEAAEKGSLPTDAPEADAACDLRGKKK
jgi:hypothetical protein